MFCFQYVTVSLKFMPLSIFGVLRAPIQGVYPFVSSLLYAVFVIYGASFCLFFYERRVVFAYIFFYLCNRIRFFPCFRRIKLKGNAVKIGNSSRCCKFQLLYHTWSTMIRLSLPLTSRCWEGAEPERVRRPALYLYRILQSAGVWTEIEKR